MKGFDVLHVKSAVKSRNKMDLSRSHLTTMDFGQIVPLFVEETIPGDKFNVGAEYFSRMAPLVKPTYGKFYFKTVQAFVPYHQLAVDAEAWLAGKTTWEGQTPGHRYFTIDHLHAFLTSYCLTSTGATATNSVYTYTQSNGTVQYRLFTDEGRYYVKVLNALGYAMPQGVDYQTSSSWYSQVRTTKLSAYPLLAFFKVYNDYMSQSQRFNTSALSNFLNCVKYGKTVTGYTPSTGALASNGIYTLFQNLFLNYENDYFTSAWQYPNSPLNVFESVNSMPITGGYNGALEADSHNNYNQVDVVTVGTDKVNITQRALDFLKSFDDWVRRNNYSGSRAVQQVYSRFGIKTDEYRSHYAHIISTDTMPIQVGDVTATADATSVPLGDYAGKGIMSGNKGFSIAVDDYGLLLIMGYFTVVPMNAFGFDRRVLRNSPLDYYNPEFDGLGADPISLGEYFASPIATGDTSLDTAVYGFTERYNSYRYGRDVITGEFRDYNPAGDMNTWHSGRNMAAIRAAGNLVAQSSAVNTLPQVNSEYNRIFSVTSGTVDHFYMTARFNVDAVRPMLNLNQVVNLGTGDTTVPRNGNVIS